MSFAAELERFAKKTTDNGDQLFRALAVEMTTRIVLRSPVGDPELWAANKTAAVGRRTHNVNLAPGAKRLSHAGLKKAYPLKAGSGYVGGRFRANWQVQVESPAADVLDDIDAGGNKAIARALAAVVDFKSGPAIYITNNLPYGRRLEYEGWSKQAPAGMVRITAAEFHSIVATVLASLKS